MFAYESGGQYAGVDTLKTRLLPWLGSSFSTVRPSVSADTSLQLLQVPHHCNSFHLVQDTWSVCWYNQDSAEKDRKIRELSLSHESDMQKMETRLSSTRLQLESVRAQWVLFNRLIFRHWSVSEAGKWLFDFHRLLDVQKELEETKSRSATTLLATEEEILQLKAEWVFSITGCFQVSLSLTYSCF